MRRAAGRFGHKAEPTRNLFENIPADLADEEVIDLLNLPSVRVERIVSRGHVTPEGEWYDQDHGEWVMVVKGAARLTIAGEPEDREMGPGNYVYLAPHVRHRVSWTDPGVETVWLAVFAG